MDLTGNEVIISAEQLSGTQWYFWLVQSFCRWFIVLSNFMSISMVITIETVKIMQAAFIRWDKNMIDNERNLTAIV
jgi:magnesium-transporting ATPase (P-type)